MNYPLEVLLWREVDRWSCRKKAECASPKNGSFKKIVTDCHADSYSRLNLCFGSVLVVLSVGTTQGRTGRSMRPVAMTIWSISGQTLPNLVLYLNL